MLNNSGINKVFLVGTIDREPRWHKSNNTNDFLCFTLTTKELIRKNHLDTEHIECHYIKVPATHPDAERLELKRGQLVHITGKIQTKTVVDEQDIKRYKTEIMALQLQVLSPAPELVQSSY
jgi:single-strand DNA-binding protein